MDGGEIMTIDKIVEYVLHTPFNTNRAILEGLLEQLILSYGGSLSPEGPDTDVPGVDVVYDGGIED